MSSAYVAATPEASSKHLRQLCQIVSNLRTAPNVEEATLLLNQCISSNALSCISPDEAQTFIAALTTALACTGSPTIISFALRLTLQTARSLPPKLYATHCHTLVQRVQAFLDDNAFPDASPTHRSQTLAAMSALLSAAAPLVRLGGTHKAHVVVACQHALRHSLHTLAIPNAPTHLALPSLSILLSVVLTAPRELRATLPHVESLLHDTLFVHGSSAVRDAAATVFAHIGLCCPGKLRITAFSGRLSALCTELIAIDALLAAFEPSREAFPPTHVKLSAMESVAALSPAHLAFRAQSICKSIKCSVAVRLPHDAHFPVASVFGALCRIMQPRAIDPYAVSPKLGQQTVSLDADGALFVDANVSHAALQTLTSLLGSLTRDIVLPYGVGVRDALHNSMGALVLEIQREKAASFSTLERRRAVYLAATEAVTSLGSGVADSLVALFSRLFEKEVSLRLQVANMCQVITDLRLSLADAGPMSRKRRRQATAAAAALAERTGEEDGFLSSVCDDAISRNVKAVFFSATMLATAFFGVRGLLSRESYESLAVVERLLMKCVDVGFLGGGVMSAITAAVASGGSNCGRALASPLFDRFASLAVQTVAGGKVGGYERKEAVAARSMCEGIIHPRGPPLRGDVGSSPAVPHTSDVVNGGQVGAGASKEPVVRQGNDEMQVDANEDGRLSTAPMRAANGNVDVRTSATVELVSPGGAATGRTNESGNLRTSLNMKVPSPSKDNTVEKSRHQNDADTRRLSQPTSSQGSGRKEASKSGEGVGLTEGNNVSGSVGGSDRVELSKAVGAGPDVPEDIPISASVDVEMKDPGENDGERCSTKPDMERTRTELRCAAVSLDREEESNGNGDGDDATKKNCHGIGTEDVDADNEDIGEGEHQEGENTIQTNKPRRDKRDKDHQDALLSDMADEKELIESLCFDQDDDDANDGENAESLGKGGGSSVVDPVSKAVAGRSSTSSRVMEDAAAEDGDDADTEPDADAVEHVAPAVAAVDPDADTEADTDAVADPDVGAVADTDADPDADADANVNVIVGGASSGASASAGDAVANARTYASENVDADGNIDEGANADIEAEPLAVIDVDAESDEAADRRDTDPAHVGQTNSNCKAEATLESGGDGSEGVNVNCVHDAVVVLDAEDNIDTEARDCGGANENDERNLPSSTTDTASLTGDGRE